MFQFHHLLLNYFLYALIGVFNMSKRLRTLSFNLMALYVSPFSRAFLSSMFNSNICFNTLLNRSSEISLFIITPFLPFYRHGCLNVYYFLIIPIAHYATKKYIHCLPYLLKRQFIDLPRSLNLNRRIQKSPRLRLIVLQNFYPFSFPPFSTLSIT